MNRGSVLSCERLHQIVHGGLRFEWRNGDITNSDRIPEHGVYLMFESGEAGHGKDRIVRIGTHTGKKTAHPLRKRLEDHYLKKNKDRSIYRKNIGRCLLNENDERHVYFDTWEMDFTKRAMREEFGHLRDMDFEAETERRITEYIRNNTTFVLISADEYERRLLLEKRLIATVNGCNHCGRSTNWFGRQSPKNCIQNSGLWLVHHLAYPEAIDEIDLAFLESNLTTETKR